MVAKLEEAIEKVKEDNNQEVLDFLARRLYNMTGDVIMSLLIIEDASKAPELFAKSANVYVRYAEEEVVGHHHFVMNFTAEELPSYRQREPKAE